MSEKNIWDFLYSKLGNKYGAAGLMGNLYVESRLNSKLLQSSYARKLGMTSEEYTAAVDNGLYSNFVHDSAGYGLAQWTYWSRKEALYSYAKSRDKSIGDLNMQLNYLWEELQKYKTVVSVLKSAKSVREASDVVVERYEKPKDMSEKAKQNRANYGQEYYNKYSGEKKMDGKIVTTTADKVNIRSGNSKDYNKVGQVQKGATFEWVATAENGWHAIKYINCVAWVSGEFSKVI